jgi:tRNA-guanine family transglycosylase
MAGESRAELRAGFKSEDVDIKRATKLKLMKHNIRFVNRLMGEMREAIELGNFDEFKQKFLENFM